MDLQVDDLFLLPFDSPLLFGDLLVLFDKLNSLFGEPPQKLHLDSKSIASRIRPIKCFLPWLIFIGY